jgi:hypothetical protein
MRLTKAKRREIEAVTAAWIDGFTACASLFAGHMEAYVKLRDEYLAGRRALSEQEAG